MFNSIQRGTAIVGAVMLATFVFASSSYADNGDLVRHGRFVWRAVSGDLNPTHGKTAAPATDSRVVYDKGDLGKYVRHGRFVSKVYEDGSVAGPSSPSGDTSKAHYRVVDHYKHKHYWPK